MGTLVFDIVFHNMLSLTIKSWCAELKWGGTWPPPLPSFPLLILATRVYRHKLVVIFASAGPVEFGHCIQKMGWQLWLGIEVYERLIGTQ